MSAALVLSAGGAAYGAASIWLLGRLSSRHAVERAADAAMAALYESRLYLDQPRLLLAAFARLVRFSLTRMALLVPAVVVLSLPSIMLIERLSGHFAHALPSGPMVVRVWPMLGAPTLVSPQPEVPFLPLDDGSFVARVSAASRIAIAAGGETVRLSTTGGARRCSGWQALLAEEALASSSLRCVELGLSARDDFPWHWPWWMFFALPALLAALLLRRRLQ